MSRYDIAVVGSGIAGAATALFLERAGHRVTRVERSERNAEGGAGLLLQPPAIAVLRAAGLDSRLWSLGAEVDHIVARFSGGMSVRLDYAEAASGLRACGVHRAALIRLLEDANEKTRCVERLASVSNVDTMRGTLRTSVGETLGPFDLVVAADGVRSTIRARCAELVVHDREYAAAAVACIVDNPDAAFCGAVRQHYSGDTHVSTWPVGVPHAGGPNGLAVALRADVDSVAGLAANPAAWLAAVTRIHSPLGDLIAAAQRMPQLFAYTYRDVTTRRYCTHRVVLIGDAAHAMSPQLGLGASLALLDAWYLTKCLAENPSIGEALFSFDRARRASVAPFQQWSRLATPLFQSSHPVAATLRERVAGGFLGSNRIGRRALAAICSVPPELR